MDENNEEKRPTYVAPSVREYYLDPRGFIRRTDRKGAGTRAEQRERKRQKKRDKKRAARARRRLCSTGR